MLNKIFKVQDYSKFTGGLNNFEYGNCLYSSLKILISSDLEIFDFLILTSNGKSEYLGTIYLTLFLISNNILILGLFKAILSSTSAMLESKNLCIK